MGRYLDLAKQVAATEGRDDSAKIGGHSVRRIIWETEKAIVFEDVEGHFWRYLHAYRQAWPVVVETKREPGEFLADVINVKARPKLARLQNDVDRVY